jgi:hypothetical protein
VCDRAFLQANAADVADDIARPSANAGTAMTAAGLPSVTQFP